MKKKLSQKERGEVVTKGFLEDYLDKTLESKNYVTKDYLESKNFVTKEYLDQQNFVTKDWALDMFETFEKRIVEEFRNHTGALMEFHTHQNQLIVDALISRIERIERHVGLPSF